MAKVVPSHLFTSVSGKLCKKGSTYIALNKHTGEMYSGEYHGCEQPNSDKQQEVKSVFTTKGKFAAAWWKANKPSTSQPKGSESYQLVMKAYKSQHKIGNPYSYLRTLVTDELKVKLGDLDITGDVKAPASAGGSSSGSGGSSAGGSGGSGSSGSGNTGSEGGGTSQGGDPGEG